MKNKNTKPDNKTPDIRKTFNRIAIIQANWHADIVEEATKSFTKELESYGYDADCFEVHDVPGSLEIPLMAQKLSETGRYDLIMATGLIVDGGIYRHDFVARTVLDAMMRVQLDTSVPVLSVVLTPHHFQETDVHREFFRKHFVIKGQEAAKACHQTLDNMRGLKELKLAS